MIFASLGTMNMPFVRMARAIDEFASTPNERVIVQTGYTDYHYQYAQAFKFCTKDEMQHYINEAAIVILQGGWGRFRKRWKNGKELSSCLGTIKRNTFMTNFSWLGNWTSWDVS